MTQTVVFELAGKMVQRDLPDPNVRVWNDIAWGEHYCLFTPAYWVSHVWMNQLDTVVSSPYYSQRSLAEEIAFCMLSGFGITAELAGAAFQTCRSRGLIEQRCTEPDVWTDTLKTPLWVNGKEVHYRYPNQKAKFLADAMNHLDAGHIECGSGRALRDSLLQIKGCGHKTAGFIARNYLDSDEVAILDIHVVRAGLLLDLFSEQDTVEKDYEEMEQRYIDFCNAIQVRPSVLDCIVWSHMRTLGSCAIDAVKFKSGQLVKNSPRARKPHQLSFAM
ncbi:MULTISPECIES: 8-oxoguanine DNA glycosylase [unclassified Simplicispira]|jgi:thermostable 8-oxoguanine DNA glycosylase|uniref:8-oxoguanine DNA glycosylase n=1 Tax=unclassified Simplicispira TaxID=2630407 RepID=UPI000D5E3D00|nr:MULTISPECIES: 8-oxoguanine DNA glycosylase [unclassified Simplicispira]PVY57926.1 thermostable 8-oxoguanine DNA glycosylase [Simplicispira sp. 125]REG18869.1 thermostable 8-oxoguanine DNA glycosylase [Simplicispira sp. 110]